MKINRYITIFVVSIPLLFIVLYFTSFIIYKNQWSSTYRKPQLESWVKEINNTPKLSANFYSVFDTLKKSNLEQTLHFEYLKLVKFHLMGFKNFHRGGGRNYYFEASRLILKKHNREINTLLNPRLTLAFGIEKKVELKKCVDYYYCNFELNLLIDSSLIFSLKGVDEFSNIYFQKEFEELNKNEVITLISAFDMATFKDTITNELIDMRLKVNKHVLKSIKEKLKK